MRQILALASNAATAPEVLGYTITELPASETPEPEVESVHIRKRVARKWGNGFYKPQYSASENGSQTLCGAPAGNDLAWGEARFPKHLARVTCDACRQIRNPHPAA